MDETLRKDKTKFQGRRKIYYFPHSILKYMVLSFKFYRTADLINMLRLHVTLQMSPSSGLLYNSTEWILNFFFKVPVNSSLFVSVLLCMYFEGFCFALFSVHGTVFFCCGFCSFGTFFQLFVVQFTSVMFLLYMLVAALWSLLAQTSSAKSVSFQRWIGVSKFMFKKITYYLC